MPSEAVTPVIDMNSEIIIQGLRLHARHGVLPQERRVGNVFELDINLTFDASLAMESDNVDHTVNYARVIELVETQMAIPSDLLENAAMRIRKAICDEFPQITAGSIALYKIHPPLKAQMSRIGFTLKW